MLEQKIMGEKEKKDVDLDFFEQLDEALEERKGTDRRKANQGKSPSGEDRRKSDRRKPS